MDNCFLVGYERIWMEMCARLQCAIAARGRFPCSSIPLSPSPRGKAPFVYLTYLRCSTTNTTHILSSPRLASFAFSDPHSELFLVLAHRVCDLACWEKLDNEEVPNLAATNHPPTHHHPTSTHQQLIVTGFVPPLPLTVTVTTSTPQLNRCITLPSSSLP